MRQLNKKLAVAATATALLGAIGASVAQTESEQVIDQNPAQQVEVTGTPSGQQIYFFRDQGISPETDPAAHLMLIKHQPPAMPVAETTTTTTTVAQTTTPDTTTTMPAAADTSNTQAADTTVAAAPVDDTPPPPAPKADRN